ncbi:preprotein translocase subunit YajC [Scopulibacillus daqui]|uniref:Preprotein translocase subunit YajC n=1 Tax=Scopulibacillus daqui TaxID=1469162 RepID=A0ABS2PXE2_9BACL|nr:preprotein translocase subunit YajC [Scopulibacillus daqui]MBM7644697.1 preprotein translocase subunit YajC [Scopulibacillus daqui]
MSGNFLATIGPLIIFFVIFYFLLIRPQQKRQKQTREMQANLQKGDKIITIGGIHGTIDVIDDEKVTIKCHNTTKITFDRAAIRDVYQKKQTHEPKGSKEKDDNKEKEEK